MKYSVLVGNIGTVCQTDNPIEANKVFGEYKRQSESFRGRAGGEIVTMLESGEIKFEHRPKAKFPTIKELKELLIFLKSMIDDDYRAYDDCDNDIPSMCVTIGWRESGEWSYQTGDNSFTGSAYGFPHWAVITLERRSNSKELAKDIISQLAELSSVE